MASPGYAAIETSGAETLFSVSPGTIDTTGLSLHGVASPFLSAQLSGEASCLVMNVSGSLG
jgi:hypothetical protein